MERTEPAISLELDRAHTALLEDLRKLEIAADAATGRGLAALRARLGTTRTHLAEHFRFEEQDGYMDAVRKQQPRLERAVGELAEEHRKLAQGLDAMILQAATAKSLDDAFRAKVRAWVEQVRGHERREVDLIQAAFNLDIGTKD
jgi:hypothetical protein